MFRAKFKPKQQVGHIWRIPQGMSAVDDLIAWGLVFIAWSLPLEGVLPKYFGIRSFAFYLTALVVGLGYLRLPFVLKSLSISKEMKLIAFVTLWSVSLYFLNPLHTMVRSAIVSVQLLGLAILYTYVSKENIWRIRIVRAYFWGWTIFILLSIVDFSSYGLTPSAISNRTFDLVLGFTANTHSLHVGLGLLIIFGFISRKPRPLFVPFLLLLSVLGTYALLFGRSRGSVLALCITLLVWFIVESTAQRHARKMLTTAFLLVTIMYFMFTQVSSAQLLLGNTVERFQSAIIDKNYSSRDLLLERSLKLAFENPLGIGQSNGMIRLAEEVPELRNASRFGRQGIHNDYLRILTEAGFLGFAIYAYAVIHILVLGWRWYRYSNEPYYFWPLVFILVEAFIAQIFDFKITWLLLALNATTPLKDNVQPHNFASSVRLQPHHAGRSAELR